MYVCVCTYLFIYLLNFGGICITHGTCVDHTARQKDTFAI